MRDLLVITPSRAGEDGSARPERAREMIAAVRGLSTAQTDICLAVDDDDLSRYGRVVNAFCGDRQVWWTSGPRNHLTGWTNKIAKRHLGKYRAFASLGDDHLPRTQGWDSLLLAAIDAMGGTGIAYGDDGIFREGLPTAPVISSDIVRALGWMCLPDCRHMAVDLAWKDLGLGAGCLAYVPEVSIEHVHPCAGKAAWDQTYATSEAGKEEDRAAWERWRENGMADDVARIRALREKVSNGAV